MALSAFFIADLSVAAGPSNVADTVFASTAAQGYAVEVSGFSSVRDFAGPGLICATDDDAC